MVDNVYLKEFGVVTVHLAARTEYPSAMKIIAYSLVVDVPSNVLLASFHAYYFQNEMDRRMEGQ